MAAINPQPKQLKEDGLIWACRSRRLGSGTVGRAGATEHSLYRGAETAGSRPRQEGCAPKSAITSESTTNWGPCFQILVLTRK